MSTYIRPRVPGASIFFTVCLARRGASLLTDEIDLLRDAVARVLHRRPFMIDAWVVMPDHMHAVWTLPEDDSNFSDRWGSIKARFSRSVREKHGPEKVGWKPTLPEDPAAQWAMLRATRSPSKRDKQDAGIWQRRFWEHHLRTEGSRAEAVRYCWEDPVKHGLAETPGDWPYSSWHRDVGKPSLSKQAMPRRPGLQPTDAL